MVQQMGLKQCLVTLRRNDIVAALHSFLLCTLFYDVIYLLTISVNVWGIDSHCFVFLLAYYFRGHGDQEHNTDIITTNN